MRGATQIFDTDGTLSGASFGVAGATGTIESRMYASLSILDSPATTSAITYKTQMNTFDGETVTVQEADGLSTIIAMEIGA